MNLKKSPASADYACSYRFLSSRSASFRANSAAVNPKVSKFEEVASFVESCSCNEQIENVPDADS